MQGASFYTRRLMLPVESFAVVIWHGDMALLDPPAIVCRSWHPREDRISLVMTSNSNLSSSARARLAKVRLLLEVRAGW